MPRRNASARREHKGRSALGFQDLREDIKALNSNLLIISQKMKYVVRNEKILGRNLIVLNKKIKRLGERAEDGSAPGGVDLAAIAAKLEQNSQKLAEIEEEIAEIKENFALKEQLDEIKYVIDSINPLEFATVTQVKDMLKKKK